MKIKLVIIKDTKSELNCNSCFDGKEQKEITAGYKNGKSFQSSTLTLCKKCRDILIEKLIDVK